MAANTVSIIYKEILKKPLDAQLLIRFSEMILILLRDDSVNVRNKASDFVFMLAHKPEDGPAKKGRPDFPRWYLS